MPRTLAGDRLTPDGRVVMVTGASRGIGRAVADLLAAQGYRLALAMRKPPRGADAADVLVHRYDALEPATAQAFVDATVARFGRIDALINNAGIYRTMSLVDEDERALDEVWAVNVKAPLRLTRYALPHLRRSGRGRVVNIVSTDGKRYRDASVSVAYAASKHALLALTHATRHAAWDDGVRVTALCPGGVETDLLDGIPGVVPGGQRLTPALVAETVAFLLSLPNVASVAELVVNTRLESTM